MDPNAQEMPNLERKSPYLEQLQQREQNLRQELSRLQAQQKKLESDVQAIEADRKAVDERDQEVTKQEKIADDQEKEVVRNEVLQKVCEATDEEIAELEDIVLSLRSILQQTRSEIVEAKEKQAKGITSTPELSKEEMDRLDEEIMNLKQEEINSRKHESIQSKIKGKIESCERLRKRLDQMKDDLVVRENDVEKIENASIAHQKKIEETNERRGALERRRILANDRKTKVEGMLSAREEKRKKIMQQREEVRLRMAEAEAEQERLDEVEDELKVEEERLDEIQRKDEESVLAAAAENEANIRKRMQKDFEERRKTQKTSHTDRLEDFLVMWEDDPVATERTFVKMERAARMKKASVEAEQKKWLELWERKQKQVDDMIEQIQKKVQESESMAQLKERFEQLKVVHDDLERKVSEDQDQLRVLSFGSEEECQKVLGKTLELEKERQRIYERNVELVKSSLQLKELEAMLEMEEPRIKVLKDELEVKLKATAVSQQASQKMVELYEKQLAAVNKRREQLKAHLEARTAQE